MNRAGKAEAEMAAAEAWTRLSAFRVVILALGVCVFAGCKHTSPEQRYTWLEPKAKPAPLTPAKALQPVKLERKFDPAWRQPSTNLFTLGPGDRLDIEIIGDPTSRTSTIVGP